MNREGDGGVVIREAKELSKISAYTSVIDIYRPEKKTYSAGEE